MCIRDRRGGTPYTHVLLSIGISIALVSLLRLLPTIVLALSLIHI